MMSVGLITQIIITLVWIAIAIFLIVRIPACKSVSIGARMFVVAFLILQVVTQAFTLYTIMTKQHVVQSTTSKATKVNIDKGTVDAMSKLLMVSFWYYIFIFFLTLVVYYIMFKTIFMCKDTIIPKKMFWLFLSITALQVAISSITKTTTDHNLMMNAVSM